MALSSDAELQSEPTIRLVTQTDLPSEWLSEFRDNLDAASTDFDVRRIDPAPMAGILLYMMQAAMIFVASQYFGSMASEAGKDHYQSLRNAVLKLWSRLKVVEVTIIGSSQAKLKNADRFNLLLSINGHAEDGSKLKLIFEKGTSDTLAAAGLEQFFNLLTRLDNAAATCEDAMMLERCRSIGKTKVLTVSQQNGNLIPADPV